MGHRSRHRTREEEPTLGASAGAVRRLLSIRCLLVASPRLRSLSLVNGSILICYSSTFLLLRPYRIKKSREREKEGRHFGRCAADLGCFSHLHYRRRQHLQICPQFCFSSSTENKKARNGGEGSVSLLLLTTILCLRKKLDTRFPVVTKL